MNKSKNNKAVIVISVIIVICCILFTLMPHSHECIDIKCSVCNLAESLREAFMSVGFTFALLFTLALITSFLNFFDNPISERENTLVGRKVKLSD